MNKGYIVYGQDKNGTCGYIKRGDTNYSYLRMNLTTEFDDNVLLFPVKEAAEARIKTYQDSSIKSSIEYICVMYFDGQQVLPIDSI